MLELERFHSKMERLTGFPLRPQVKQPLLATLFFLLFTFSLSTDFIVGTVSLHVGQVSDRDIAAPRTMSYINHGKTKLLEAEVSAGVATVYDLDTAVTAKAEENIKSIFRIARSLLHNQPAGEKRTALIGALPMALPEETIQYLLGHQEQELSMAEEHVKSLLMRYLQRGVRRDEVELVKRQIELDAERLKMDDKMQAAVLGVVHNLLTPNFILNQAETEKRRRAAIDSMEPVRETVIKGQILLRKGDIVTDEHISAMKQLGLHQDKQRVFRLIGLAIFVLLVMILSLAYFERYEPAIFANTRHLMLVGLTVLLTVLLTRVAHYYSDFIAPIATGSLLVAILFSARAGVLVCIALAMLCTVTWQDGRMLAVALAGGLTGVYSVSKVTHGYSLTMTGVRLAAANVLVIGATGWTIQLGAVELLIQAAQGALGGIASAIISIGVLPYLENSFNITTPLKLLELTKPTHPLLQRLLIEAPGTYHHSIIVGNLAETAAGKIGADTVTVRVGAYYHDIGKLKRPYFFAENQVDENPHDKISPSLSALIILSHTRDGVDLAREYDLPQVVQDIIQQHHGVTLASFFYQKATETGHCECINEADFRYEGPRPQSQEAALVLLADACEAAVRSLGRPNVHRIEATVRRIIKDRLHDGQLDDCSLTLRDLQEIGDVFIRVLSSMYHKRIEYPDSKDVERRKSKSGNSAK